MSFDSESESRWSFLSEVRKSIEGDPHSSKRKSVTGSWNDDNDNPTCEACGIRFGLLVRRHHCRWCGRVLCHRCCQSKVPDVDAARRAGMTGKLCCATCKHRAASFAPAQLCDNWDHHLHKFALGRNGHLAGHCVCVCDGALPALKAIIEDLPDCTRLENTRGELMLHAMLRRGPDVDVEALEFVMDANRRALTEKTSLRNLPLHIAALSGCTTNVIARVLSECPSAANVPGERGNYPLHLACMAAHPCLSAVEVLASAQPAVTSAANDRGDLPLHCCAHRGIDVDVMRLIVKLHAPACYVANRAGEVPLACCVRAGLSARALEVLVNASPDLMMTFRSRYGETMLHVACSTYASARPLSSEAFSLILEHSSTKDIVETNQKGDTPLHTLARSRVGSSPAADIAFELATKYANLCLTRNKSGDLPVHLAVRKGTNMMMVQQLLRANPSSIYVRDGRGELPLHSVCFHPAADDKLIRMLLRHAVHLVHEPDLHDRRPYDVAKLRRIADVVFWSSASLIWAAHLKNHSGNFDLLPAHIVRRITYMI